MRRMTYFVMALAMVLGLAQCKKEQPAQNETEGVFITLTLDGGNSNSRVNVDPTGNNGLYNYATVQYEEGDVIYVGYNGSYVGQLTCQSGNTTFSGNINVTEEQATQPLDLYFLGGKDFALPTIDEENNTATLVISNQTASYPVISYARSEYYEGSHHAKLMNKCSIMKFDVTTPSSAAICITGMNNKVTLNFNPETEGTDEGFTYDINTEDGGLIKMPAKDESNETWAIVLPQGAYEEEGAEGTVYSEDHYYTGKRPVLPAIQSNKYLADGIAMTVTTNHIVDLAMLTEDYEAKDGDILINTLAGNYKISVNTDNATITLRSATINGNNSSSWKWAGITCQDNTTIILEGTNTVTGFYEDYPGIFIASGKTLTIEGNGSLDVSSNGWGAGIGSNDADCGNIVINSGTISATGGIWMAGIGCGYAQDCGDITINGGTVTATGGIGAAGIGTGLGNSSISCGNISITGGIVNATGGLGAAGIGSGFVINNNHNQCGNISITGGQVTATGGDGGNSAYDILENDSWANISYYGGAGIGTGSTVSDDAAGYSDCGTITVTDGVTSVSATKGNDAPNSIGRGKDGTCGTITIGGTEYPSGATPNQTDGLTFIYPMVTTITWDQTTVGSICINVNENYEYTDGIITIEPSTNNAIWSGNSIQLYDTEDNLTFSTSTVNITKIEITFDEMVGIPSSNWTCTDHKLIWTGFSSFVELGCMASAKGVPDSGDPGVGPGGGGAVTIEPIFQLTFVTKVEFTVRQ